MPESTLLAFNQPLPVNFFWSCQVDGAPCNVPQVEEERSAVLYFERGLTRAGTLRRPAGAVRERDGSVTHGAMPAVTAST